MRRWRVVAGSVLAASTATACSLLLGIGDETFTSPQDSGSDESVVAMEAGDGGRSCVGEAPPPRPPGADPPAGPMLVFAFTAAGIGADPDGGPRKGFNLDGVCSCDPTDPAPTYSGQSCVLPEASLGACDDDGGIDDGVGHLFDGIDYLNPQALVADFQGQLHCGHVGVLVVITDYNLKADDPAVGVAFIPSPGIQEPHPDGGDRFDPDCIGGDAGVPFYVPNGDTTDLWSVLEGGVLQNGQPDPNIITPGWVSNFQLVVDTRGAGSRSPVLHFPLGGAPISVHSPILTARFVGVLPDGGITDAGSDASTALALRDGVATGRVAATDFLASLSTLPIRLSGTSNFTTLCEPGNELQYEFVKSRLCPGLDIRSSPSDDGKGLSCDALSLVVTFEASQGSIGDAGAVTADASCTVPVDTTCDGY